MAGFRDILRPTGMRARFFVLLGVVFVPMTLLQLAIYVWWYQARLSAEIDANLSLSQSVAATTAAYVRDVVRQEHAMGEAILRLPDRSAAKVEDFLEVNAAQYPTIQAFHWLDSAGVLTAASEHAGVGTRLDDRDYFKAIQAGAESYVSDVIQDRITREDVVIIALGIREPNGALLGIMTASILPGKWQETFEAIQRPPDAAIILYDRNGGLVLRTPMPATMPDIPGKEDSLAQDAYARGQAAGRYTSAFEREPRLGARVLIPEIGWVAGASRSYREAMEPLRMSLITAGLLWSALVLLSGTAASVMYRKISRSLELLQQQARTIQQGNYGECVRIDGVRELDELAQGFNRAAAEIAQRDELRQQTLDRLSETTEELARSNRDLEQFAYVASHDLQEPLRMISGYLQLIERRYNERLDDDGREFMQFAIDGSHRMRDLIVALLAYSRVGRGAGWAPVVMEDVVRHAVDNMRTAVAESEASIDMGPLPTVSGDATQLTQVFQNLIANAIKFRAPDRRLRIEVGARPDIPSGYVFWVRDNGIGIEPQYFERIFVIFQRLHGRGEYPGTGIGLALCKKIVERHGGRIWVESEYGRGSTFYFTIANEGDGT